MIVLVAKIEEYKGTLQVSQRVLVDNATEEEIYKASMMALAPKITTDEYMEEKVACAVAKNIDNLAAIAFLAEMLPNTPLEEIFVDIEDIFNKEQAENLNL